MSLPGRVSDHTGGFAQGTYSDINNAFHLDQVDVRPYDDGYRFYGDGSQTIDDCGIYVREHQA